MPAAPHAIQHRNLQKRSRICSNSKLVVMGATGKASKWKRHDWQGSRGPMGHVDLWHQLLSEIAAAGPTTRWLHVPSHVGIVGNSSANTVADMGRRQSPLLAGFVTTARHPMAAQLEDGLESESDLDEAPLWSPGGEREGTRCTPSPTTQTPTRRRHTCDTAPPSCTPHAIIGGTAGDPLLDL